MSGSSLAIPMASPRRGEVWLADLDPTRGHEQAGRRPVLVISDDLFNQGPAGLAVVLPITSTWHGIPLHIRLPPPEGGPKTDSTILSDAIRSISQERLLRHWGEISEPAMRAVEERLRVLLRL